MPIRLEYNVVTGPGLELLKRDVVLDKIQVEAGLPLGYTAVEYKRMFLLGQLRVEIYRESRGHVFVLFSEKDGMYRAWLTDKNKKRVTTKHYKNIERCLCWCLENS